MVQIEQAALSRTDIPPSERIPFTLLVDEWPSFAANEKTIGTILSQTRKFNLRLYLAAQSLSQVSSARLAGALENCRLTIAFGLGRDSAEIQSKHIGQADPFVIKEAALTETQHNQYLSVFEQFEQWTSELQNLPPRMAYAKLHDQPAVKIKTLTVPEARVDPGELQEEMGEYQRRYQRTKEEADSAIARIVAPVTDKTLHSADGTASKPAYTTLFRRHNRPKDDGDKPLS